jgi:hypothetical protein
MKYYSDIQEAEDGYFIVSEKKRVLSINKTARYRINLPNEEEYNEHLGPYAVEEKVGRRWVKIGVLSPAKQNSRKHAQSRRVDQQKHPIVKKKSIPRDRTDDEQTAVKFNQIHEIFSNQQTGTVPQIIFDHLGGKNFMIQIGATDIREGISTLSFKLKKNLNNISYIIITLNEVNKYDVDFLKVKNYEVKILKELYNIHSGDLQKRISEETGIAVN